MTRFALETYESLIEDIKPLLPEQHKELALYQGEIPLDPDYSQYKAAYDAGFLKPYTARIDNSVIGYAIFHVTPRHSHYRHRWAINDIFWIAHEHRNIGNGNGLCEFFEKDLSADGPIVIHIETKIHAPALAILLRTRGYGLVGPSFSKRFV